MHATIRVTGINIDRTRPRVRITGLRAGRIYELTAPAAQCRATDRVSGIRSCKLSRQITRHGSGYSIRYLATATSRSGATVRARIVIAVSTIELVGATRGGPDSYVVTPGSDYVLEVLSNTRPSYLNAAPGAQRPTGPHRYFRRDGSVGGMSRWETPIRITRGFARFPSWTIGIQTGGKRVTLRLLT